MKLFNIIILSLVLTSCGGGGGSQPTNTSENGNNFITLSDSSIKEAFFSTQSGSYTPVSISVNVIFNGDGVLIGYAPDVTQESWLSFPDRQIQATGGSFDFTVTISPPLNSSGAYSTSIRLLTGDIDGSNPAYVDLHISYEIYPTPNVYTGEVSFNSYSNDLTLPARQTIQLDFSPLTNYTWSARVENTNNLNTNWNKINPIIQNNQLDIDISSLLPVGQYQADIVFDITFKGTVNTINIPLTYTVTAATPEINYISPTIGYVNKAGTINIHGTGFSTETIVDVKIDGVSSSSFTKVSDNEITANFLAMSTEGVKSVSVMTNNNTYTSAQNFIIKSPIVLTAHEFALDTGIVDMVHDETRDALLVSTDTTLYRISQNAGVWSIVKSRAIAFGEFDMTPDAKFILSADSTGFKLLDAVTLEDAINYQNLPSRYASIYHTASNGNVFFTNSESTFFQSFNLVNKTISTVPVPITSRLTRASHSRDRIIFATYGDIPKYTGIYDVSTNSFTQLSSTATYASNRFSLSGEGNRLIANPDSLFDLSLNHLGTLAANSEPGNYSLEIATNGLTGYKVDAGSGIIYPYDLTAGPTFLPIVSTTYTFTPYSNYAAAPGTIVSHDNQVMFLGGGTKAGTIRENRIVIVPVN